MWADVLLLNWSGGGNLPPSLGIGFESFVAQTGKIGELYTNLAKEAFRPMQSAFAKVQAEARTPTFGVPKSKA